MQIVINIDEEVYKDAMNGISNGLCRYSNEAIRNGTPLPKGHGDLIDADKALQACNEHIKKTIRPWDTIPKFVWCGVINQSVVIPSNKEVD